MAGVSDIVFRELCVSFGAAYTVSEMVSAKALTLGDKKSNELMRLSDNERPSGIQIFGNDPYTLAQSVNEVIKYSPDFIDINMGCPAPKIVKNHSGSYLLKEPVLAEEIVKKVVESTSLPVTVKMRTGYDESSKNHIEMAKRFEAAGVGAITVHGRTRERMYMPPADLDAIREVKKAVNIPVIGNGDIFTPEDAKRMYDYTGCDFIMIGRGAQGRPWIFNRINEYLTTGSYSPDPSNEEKMSLMLEHSKRICELRGERNGICEMRKHALWYTKGIRGSNQLRNRFSTVKSLSELNELADIVIKNG
ncbi:MAG: tRNA dihydrouridine synthase DusB [Oscillospiraceae bacterium]|nr:tRNA dihydrouridine synthase DusB [Oscillospiraceae bacterium]